MTRSGEVGEPDRSPGMETLRALAGGPRLGLNELRERLDLSADTFIDVWEGRTRLHGSVRERLAEILREEIEWRQRLLVALGREGAVEEEAARARREEDGREER